MSRIVTPAELRDMTWTYSPLSTWPHEETPFEHQRGRFTFKAGWDSTVVMLKHELCWLEAQDVKLAIGVRPDQIKKDGGLKAGVNPVFPGVEISFQSETNLTPLARRGRELIRRYGSYKEAAKHVHPDIAGGSQEDFAAIGAANDHRRIVFATDSCVLWRHNVRSLALGLASLRDVDRYGMTKRGQQYAGFAGALTA